MKTTWRLPRGVDELLPPAAWALEELRRAVLDLFTTWGYDYIEPPVIEYLEALLVGSGEDQDLQTLKVVDQVSGRQLGVRADMTSQAVRVDAHSLPVAGVQRLCYAGPVVFANPQLAQASRVPLKAGVEIFGAADVSADAEVVTLMVAAVRAAAVERPVLLLGHMGIYRSLVAALDLDDATEAALFACVQRKSQADIRALLPDSPAAHMLAELPMLMGDVAVIEGARSALAAAGPGVLAALDELAALLELVQSDPQLAEIDVRIDVAELSGYGYHNGPVFAVYHPQHGRALAQGGRYDGIGQAFGRGRPATGFDMDLKVLSAAGAGAVRPIFAPFVQASQRSELLAAVAALRAEGERVSMALSADEQPAQDCTRTLVEVNGQWQVTAIQQR